MKKKLLQGLLFTVLSLSVATTYGQSVPVIKTNPTKVYIHYMPWFTAPENPGTGPTNFGNGATGTFNKWGAHWSHINNNNTAHPDSIITVTNNQGSPVQTRSICAHYHPLIGPYDGQDSAVLQYHLLLMKLSGIDGVLIDWYGRSGYGAPDAAPLLVNSNALIARTRTAGLKFGLIMEDAAWNQMPGADSNGAYIVRNYFTDSQYIKLGDMRGANATNANAPLVGVFGPQQFKSPGQWNTILQGNTGAFLPLYNQSAQVGADAAGEFTWPFPQAGQGGNPPAWYANTSNYYTGNARFKNVVLGAAYPGFFDFYGANGADQDGIIPRNYGPSGNTLSTTLALFTQNQSVLDGLQLVTWNDFSEGTIIEPTIENGFQNLDTIQKFTGVPYTEADLQQVYRFFTLRKKYLNDNVRQQKLNQVFNYFTSLQIDSAVILMDLIDNSPVVSVSSTGSPSEDGATGTFIISATNLGSDITVTYTVSGTRAAQYYTSSPALTGSVTLTPASPSDTFTIAAVDDTIVDPKETVILTIPPDTTYNISKNIALLTIADNEIPPCSGPMVVNTNSAPIIDGAVDAAWSKAPVNAITKTVNGTLQPDYAAQWRAMYDSNFLYVLVEVKDSSLRNDAPEPWENDAVEIYIDGTNSKAGAYTSSDFQYGFQWGLPPAISNMYGTTPRTGIVYAVPSVTGGYNLEAKIPWSTINGGNPFNGKQIGFDININDNDYGQTRQATSGWFASENDEYANPSAFGVATLTICNGDTTLSNPAVISIGSANGKEYYPFPVYTILASNSPTSYSAANLPAGLNIDTSTGIISGTPTVWGNFNVTVSATNTLGTANKVVIISIDSTPAVLFSTITASRQPNNMVSIQWIVDSEIAIKQYNIQQSVDGVNFTTIDSITQIGNNNIDSVIYNTTDLNPLGENEYYRVIGSDFNGDTYYSTIASINKPGGSNIFPNPLSGNIIYIPFNNATAETYSVRLLNYTGQSVYKTSITVNAGISVYPLQLDKKPSGGCYLLELINQQSVKMLYKIMAK